MVSSRAGTLARFLTIVTTKGNNMFNISTRRVGGLRFVKIGRFTFIFCISREFRPL